MSETVCIVGVGYVGLPLAVSFAEEGFDVVGFDINEAKIETFRNGNDPTRTVGADAVAASDVLFTTDPVHIEDADYVLITVPTPVDESNCPDLSAVEAAGRTVGEHLSPGALVIFESTVYPGATEELLVPTVEAASGMTCDEEFDVAYSPERATAGDAEHSLRNVQKIVSARSEEALQRVVDLYGTVIDAGLHRAPDIRTAEAAKCAENIQRDVNIALVNEFAMVFDRLGLDTTAVLDAAATKWNFHRYSPGLVGGHCIPVDPYYMIHRSEQAGYTPNLMSTARQVNDAIPEHVATQVLKALNGAGKVPRESRILLLGLTYKPDATDIRTAAAGDVIDALREYDVSLVGHDPYADPETARALFDIELQPDLAFDGFDAVLLMTPHSVFLDVDLTAMGEAMSDDPVLVDVKGALDGEAASQRGFVYRTL